MNAVIKKIHLVFKWILVFLMSLMVIDVTWQVFSRFILRQSSSITEELATFLLIWIGLLGSAYALQEKAHLGIDLITNRLSPRGKIYSEIISFSVVIVVALLVFVIGGLRLVYITIKLNQISPALRINMGYIYSVIPLTGVLFILYSCGWIYASISKIKLKKESQIS